MTIFFTVMEGNMDIVIPARGHAFATWDTMELIALIAHQRTIVEASSAIQRVRLY